MELMLFQGLNLFRNVHIRFETTTCTSAKLITYMLYAFYGEFKINPVLLMTLLASKQH